MKKKFSLYCLMILSSLMCFVGCSCGNPYDKMSISVDKSGVVLFVDDTKENDPDSYTYVTVTVNGAGKGVSTDILCSAVQSDVAEVLKVGQTGNQTTLLIKGKDIGSTAVTIKTKEGNLESKVGVDVERKVTGAYFKGNIAFKTGATVNLYDYVGYYPEKTSQTGLEFSLVDNEGFVYSENYAKITDSMLYINKNAAWSTDGGVTFRPIEYVVIKAVSTVNPDVKIAPKEITVLSVIDDIESLLTTVEKLDSADNGIRSIGRTEGVDYDYYEVLLGLNSANSFITSRVLTFNISKELNINNQYLVDFNYNATHSQNNGKVFLTKLEGQTHSFKVDALLSGVQVVAFDVKYKGYEHLFTHTYYVNFRVVNVPDVITTSFEGFNSNDPIYIYDTYGGNLTGVAFNAYSQSEIPALKYSFALVDSLGVKYELSEAKLLVNGAVYTGAKIDNGSQVRISHNSSNINSINEKNLSLRVIYEYTLNPAGGTSTVYGMVYSTYKDIPFSLQYGVKDYDIKTPVLIGDVETSVDDPIYGEVLTSVSIAESSIGLRNIVPLSGNRITVSNGYTVNYVGGGNGKLEIFKNGITSAPIAVLKYDETNETKILITAGSNVMSETFILTLRSLNGIADKTINVTVLSPIDYVSTRLNLDNSPGLLGSPTYDNGGDASPVLNLYYSNSATPVKTKNLVGLAASMAEFMPLKEITVKTNSTFTLNFYNLKFSKVAETETYKLNAYNLVSFGYDITMLSDVLNAEKTSATFKTGNKTGELTLTVYYTTYKSNLERVVFAQKIKVTVERVIDYIEVINNNIVLQLQDNLGVKNTGPSMSKVNINFKSEGLKYTPLQNPFVVYGFNTNQVIKIIDGVNILAEDVLSFDSSQPNQLIAKLSNAGKNKLQQISDLRQMNKEIEAIKREIFADGIFINIEIIVVQHNITIVGNTTIKIELPKQVENIVTNLTQTGVYIELNKNADPSHVEKIISAMIGTSDDQAYNQNLVAYVANESIAVLRGIDSNTGRIQNGQFKLIPVKAGVTSLIIAAEDCFISDGGIQRPSWYIEFRVKIADGLTVGTSFELTNANFNRIGTDIAGGDNDLFYVLTENINLASKGNVNFDEFNGYLNGFHSFAFNGETIERQYNILNYNPTFIAKNGTGIQNFGLFKNLAAEAQILNLHFYNSTINVVVGDGNSSDIINIGFISGTSNAGFYGSGEGEIGTITSAISNSMVSDSTAININHAEGSSLFAGTINAGGLVGYLNEGAIIKGLPNPSLITLKSNSMVTISADINVLNSNKLNIGGVVGHAYVNNATVGEASRIEIMNMAATAIINSNNKPANIGGVVGFAQGLTSVKLDEDESHFDGAIRLTNVVSMPYLTGMENIGGLIGKGVSTSIINSTVEFANNGLTDLNSAAIVGYNNIGGLIGNAQNFDISLSYVRGYVDEAIDNNNYVGNMVALKDLSNSITEANIGGLIGRVEKHEEIDFIGNVIYGSYFNADINTFYLNSAANVVNTGGLIGFVYDSENIEITNSYTNGRIKTASSVIVAANDMAYEFNEDYFTDYDEFYNNAENADKAFQLVLEEHTKLVTIYYTDHNVGLFVGNETTAATMVDEWEYEQGSEEGEDYEARLLSPYNLTMELPSNISIQQSYSIIRNLTDEINTNGYSVIIDNTEGEKAYTFITAAMMHMYVIGDTTNVYDVAKVPNLDKPYSPFWQETSLNLENYIIKAFDFPVEGESTILKNGTEYELAPIYSEEEGLENEIIGYERPVWAIHPMLNNGFPIILISENSALYSMIPSYLDARVLDSAGERFSNNWYIDCSTYDEGDPTNIEAKIVLFYNELLDGPAMPEVNEYYILQNGEPQMSSNEISISAINVLLGIEQIQGLNINVNTGIIIESNRTEILKVEGNKLITAGTGLATLTFTSVMDKTKTASIQVLIVGGISQFSLFKNLNTNNNTNAVSNGAEVSLYVSQELNYAVGVQNTNNSGIGVSRFKTNNSIGYKLTVNSISQSCIIKINGEELSESEIRYSTTLSNFKIEGIKAGSANITITPFIRLNAAGFGTTINGLTNCVEMQNLEKAYTINVNNNAISFNLNGKSSATITPDGSGSISSTVLLSKNIDGEINDKIVFNFVNEGIKLEYTLSMANGSDVPFWNFTAGNYEGILINLKNEVELVSDKDSPSAEFKIKTTFTFNYSQFLNDIANLSNKVKNYEIEIYPDSNRAIGKMFNLGIKPEDILTMRTSFYSSGEVTIAEGGTGTYNPSENSSEAIVQGRSGLIKLSVEPVINSADYIEIMIEEKYRKYIEFSQKIVNLDSSGNIISGNAYVNTIGKATIIRDSDFYQMGIRLLNQSVFVNSNTALFNGYYYLAVRLLETAPVAIGEKISFYIQGYDKNGVAVGNGETLTLSVQPLPSVNIQFNTGSPDEANNAILTVGSRTEIIVTTSNLADDYVFGEGNLSIVWQSGFESNSTIVEIVHDRILNKFYLNVPSNAKPGSINNITGIITAKVSRNLNGQLEETEHRITFEIVLYKVEKMTVSGASSISGNSGTLEILSGEAYKLSVKLQTSYAADNGAVLNQILTRQLTFENELSGISPLTGTSNQYAQIWREYVLKPDYNYNTNNYSIISTDRTKYKDFSISEVTNSGGRYYALVGLLPGTAAQKLIAVAQYYYDTNGLPKFLPSGSSAPAGANAKELQFIFTIVIKDNSTYDNPHQIDNVEKFRSMQQDAHYILLNDLVLENWSPIEANFASLDGNGCTLTIISYNFDSLRGTSNVNAGVFSTVSSGTVIKNLNIDVANLLISQTDVKGFYNPSSVQTDINPAQAVNSKINLTEIQSLNFGVLAGTNNGAITNVKIINTKEKLELNSGKYIKTGEIDNNKTYLHVLTTRGDVGNYQTTIGGIVGYNSGSISKSFVGNEINVDYKNKIISGNVNKSTYGFTVSGGITIGGFVGANSTMGIVTNSFVNHVGVWNNAKVSYATKTGGFIATNYGYVSGCFVEGEGIGEVSGGGDKIKSVYVANDNVSISSTGSVGGFVYDNSGLIENSYCAINVQTTSGNTGGFVYDSTAAGSLIKNCYTTAAKIGSRNGFSDGFFVGMGEVDEFNYLKGTLEACYYLLLEEYTPSEFEPAVGISGEDVADKNLFSNNDSFVGFSFATGTQNNGIWEISTESGPRIRDAETFTYSHRTLITEEGGLSFYQYDTEYMYGSSINPLLVKDASDFVKFIINNSTTEIIGSKREGSVDRAKVFGGGEKNTVRLISNIDFTGIQINNIVVDGYILGETIFAGTLEGNAMTLRGISLTNSATASTGAGANPAREDFGLFRQIGLSASQQSEIEKTSFVTTIKNIKITYGTISTSGAKRVGVLAGSIYNASLLDIEVTNLGANTIQAENLAGGIAGLIAGDCRLIEIKVNGVRTNVTGRTGNVSLDDSDDSILSNIYSTLNQLKSFTDKYTESIDQMQQSTLADNKQTDTNNLSYSGSIAGIIDVSNRPISSNGKFINDGLNNESNDTIGKHRTQGSAEVKRLFANDGGSVIAEKAGGLFGGVGPNTHIKDSAYYLGSNVSGSSVSNTITGHHLAGGIVAENYGFLEQVRVENVTPSVVLAIDEAVKNGTLVQGPTAVFVKAGDNNVMAVGGIAAYSQNGVIIDSYSQLNVSLPNAIIAGGLIGIAIGDNHLSHDYVTGNVFALKVVGGVVGLSNVSASYNEKIKHALKLNKYIEGSETSLKSLEPAEGTNVLYLDYVFGLNIWDNSNPGTTNLNTTLNKLRDQVKSYYENGSGSGNYYNSITRMPEIGNQNAEFIDESTYNDNFKGQAGTAPNLPGYPSSVLENRKFFAGSLLGFDATKGSSSIYNNIREVQFGSYKDPEAVGEGFGAIKTVITSTPAAADFYPASQFLKGEGDDYNAPFDFIKYSDQIGSQEKAVNILGGPEGNNAYNNKMQMFLYDHNAMITSEALTDEDNYSQTWNINENSYLPKHIIGVYTKLETLKSVNEILIALAPTETQNKLIVVEKESYNFSVAQQQLSDQYIFPNDFKGTMIGLLDENGNKPTFEITLGNTAAKSFFPNLIGATIVNIDFVINLGEDLTTITTHNNGFIANEVKNSVLQNCNITIKVKTSTKKITIGNSDVKSFGLVFGSVYDSKISNMKLDIKEQNIDIVLPDVSDVSNAVYNYGGMFGVLKERVNLTEVELNLNSKNITIKEGGATKANIVQNIGGMIGALESNSNVNNFTIEANEISLKKNGSTTSGTLNFGAVAGSNKGYIKNSDSSGKIIVKKISASDEINGKEINIGGAIGYQTGKIENVALNYDYELETQTKGETNINVSGLSGEKSVNIGGVIGFSNSSNILGLEGYNVINNNNLKVKSSGKNSTVSVGGIVGLAESTAVQYAINAGEIDVENLASNNLRFGGLIGTMSGGTVHAAYNAGKIKFKSGNTYSVGGLVGYCNSEAELKNFIVYGDIERGADSAVQNAINSNVIGGVFGNAKSGPKINNALVLAQVKNGKNSVEAVNSVQGEYTSVIKATGNGVNENSSNIYYIKELFPYSYRPEGAIDYYKFKDELNTATTDFLNKLGDGIGSCFEVDGETIAPRLKGMVNPGVFVSTVSGEKLNPKIIENEAGFNVLSSEFVILKCNLENKLLPDNFEGLLSGSYDTVANAYPIITLSNGNAFVKTNKGSISNLQINVKSNKLQKGYFAETNEGIIINCATYGYIDSCEGAAEGNKYASFAHKNSGIILNSGTNIVYNINGSVSISAFAYENSGALLNCFTTSSAYADKTGILSAAIDYYRMVQTNAGGFIIGGYAAGSTNSADITVSNGNIETSVVIDSDALSSNLGRASKYSTSEIIKNESSKGKILSVAGGILWISDNDIKTNFGYPTISGGVTLPSILEIDGTLKTFTTSAGHAGDETDNYVLILHNGLIKQFSSSQLGVVEESAGKYIYYNLMFLNNLTITSQLGNINNKKVNGYLNTISCTAGNNTTNNGLFGKVENNSTVENINVEGLALSQSTGGSETAIGAIVNEVNVSLGGTLEFKKITLMGTITIGINTDCYVGGIIGKIGGSGTVNIVECVNGTTIKSTAGSPRAGGLVGGSNDTRTLTLNIENCTNNGSILVANNNGVGGLIGYFNGKEINVKNSYNKTESGSKISAEGSSAELGVGGIAGYVVTTDTTSAFTNVTNSQDITSAGKNVGGIVGFATNLIIVLNKEDGVKNTGNISALQNAGGIMGKGSNVQIKGTGSFVAIKNNGKVITTETTSNVGGIAGVLANGTIEYSANYNKEIVGKTVVGGIVGMATNSIITGCQNGTGNTEVLTGKTSSADFEAINTIGGIVGLFTGDANSQVIGCSNAMVIKAKHTAGGIIGQSGSKNNSSDSNSVIISGNTNNGEIRAYPNYVGGIVGYANATTTISGNAINANIYVVGDMNGSHGEFGANYDNQGNFISATNIRGTALQFNGSTWSEDIPDSSIAGQDRENYRGFLFRTGNVNYPFAYYFAKHFATQSVRDFFDRKEGSGQGSDYNARSVTIEALFGEAINGKTNELASTFTVGLIKGNASALGSGNNIYLGNHIQVIDAYHHYWYYWNTAGTNRHNFRSHLYIKEITLNNESGLAKGTVVASVNCNTVKFQQEPEGNIEDKYAPNWLTNFTFSKGAVFGRAAGNSGGNMSDPMLASEGGTINSKTISTNESFKKYWDSLNDIYYTW